MSHSGDSGIAGSYNLIPAPRRAEPALGTLDAALTWASFAPRLGAGGRVRLAKDGRNYRRRDELALDSRLPAYVAAVYIYHHGVTRLLPADFDTSKAAAVGAADPAALVEQEVADFAALVAACGGECFTDVSPTGGRHVYVPWAEPKHFGEMRRLGEALARRYVTFDPSPLLNCQEGLIRPPGAWHRRGGYQRLADPAEYASWVLDHPNGAGVWGALHDALMPELEAVQLPERPERETPSAPAPRAGSGGTAGGWLVDEDGREWLPRPAGPLPRLSPALEEIARTGQYDPRQYDSPSEARQAVVAGAAACGWQLSDVAARLRAGHWPGLAGFYSRYRTDPQRAKALIADWRNAVLFVAVRSCGRDSHTRGSTHSGGAVVVVEEVPVEVRPPIPGVDPVGELQRTRAWYSALGAAVRGRRWTGQKGLTVRRVLLAMLKAAQLSHTTTIGFGCRHLALLAGLDESTVAKTLKMLRQEPDPFIDWVAEHRGERADVYRLIVPQAYAEAAAWRCWPPGRLGGIHPVFRVLGGCAAFVYEVLDAAPVRTFDLPGMAGLSPTGVSDGLRALAEYGLAVRTRDGWVRGPADPGDVADQLDVPELIEQIMARYRRQRAEWRKFLAIVDVLAPEFDDGADDIPEEALATLGMPGWIDFEPHGPPIAR
ncbi:hypothetical protein [Nonomuraea glycinis]|uniref:hypothetical protein n=1 Tax=Nonomuraea glycinis TaxID=2047744 RepID=UPI0033A1631B